MKYLIIFTMILFSFSSNLYSKSYTAIQRMIVNKNFQNDEKADMIEAMLKQKKYKNDVNFIDKHGYTALDLAVIHNSPKIVKILLENGANPNMKDKNGYTPLHRAIIRYSYEIVELLLKNKADPNIKDKHGYTPLHRAVIQQDPKLVAILLKYGADPNIKDSHGFTPLERVFMFEDIDMAYKIGELLLKHKANPFVTDRRGRTLFDKLSSAKGEQKKLLQLLIKYAK